MAITLERLRQTFCEGGAQEIYLEIKTQNDFVGFAKQFVFSTESQVARNALWGLCKASNREIAELQVILDDLIDLTMRTSNSSVRRMALNIIERLEINTNNLRTDFLDFCMEEMICLEECSGIQSLAMKLAYRMCTLYPELLNEMMRLLDSMDLEYYKPAVINVRNRIICGKF
ncbi:MAG: hypothetical protein K6E54_03825 [Bacteroidaceae bacterium]|nr:hypothetical protein [Bacteroidaceae bacterium]